MKTRSEQTVVANKTSRALLSIRISLKGQTSARSDECRPESESRQSENFSKTDGSGKHAKGRQNYCLLYKPRVDG